MILLGLTGSIGMGKSATARLFAQRGIPVWDADATVHDLYGQGGAAVEPLDAAFKGVVRDGAVDREALRKIVTTDAEALSRLNNIVHPLVAEARAQFLSDQTGALVVLDIPLLFETGSEDRFDKIAVVSVDAETQRDRVLARKTMTPKQFKVILAQQIPDAEKRARADYVIDTSTPETAKRAVERILAELT